MRVTTSLYALGLGLFAATVSPVRAAPPAADVAHGKIVFQQNCALCHATAAGSQGVGGQGPTLAGVVGRRAGSLPAFQYTGALASSGLHWAPGTLDHFLANPGALVPGTTMVVAITEPVDRRDLVAYLATLSANEDLAATNREGPGVQKHAPGDWQNDAPGVRHRVRVEELPPPYATRSAGNSPSTVARPANAALSVPPGFRVSLVASGLSRPRLLRTAPNGDIFIAETAAGRIRVLRAADGAEAPTENTVFADHLQGPFGIAFYPVTGEPRWLYVANLNSVVRFPYHSGDLRARGAAETVVGHFSANTGGHSTRDIAFSLDGQRLFLSVGSASNVAEGMPKLTPDALAAWEAAHGRGASWDFEANRAVILVTDPEGRQPLGTYATGIRNAVGLAVHPTTGDLWASTNERDGLGDDLVPDYLTRVREGGFYGWPWYYLGGHEGPRHRGARPDLAGAAILPDVLAQAHSAMLQMTFYPLAAAGPAAFPPEYRGDAFAASHGSWNRTTRTGSKVVRVRLRNGVPSGEYEDFLTGFVVDDSHVWGRPVGVAVARDGALLVTDDANGTLWRIAYGP